MSSAAWAGATRFRHGGGGGCVRALVHRPLPVASGPLRTRPCGPLGLRGGHWARRLPDGAGGARSDVSADEAAAGRGGRRLIRRQRGCPARTPHPPSADPLARPRHRPGRRPLRPRPPAGRGPRRGRAPRRRPKAAAGPRRRRLRQAVEALSIGHTAAFWWPGSAGGLTVSRPAAVPLRRQGRTGTLSVSHPTRTGEPQELEWGRPVRKVPGHPDAVEILPTGPRPRSRVTRGEACATPRVRRLSAAELCATPTSSRPSEQSKRLHSRLVLFSATRKTPRRL